MNVDRGANSTPVGLQAENLQPLPGVGHGFFTRAGGVSGGIYASLNCGLGSGDDAACVARNRSRATDQLAVGAAKLITLYQTHSTDIAVFDDPQEILQAPPGERPRADASVTNQPNLALGILTADCAPVLLVDPAAGVIGAAHAGWRGAHGGIVQACVEAMTQLGAAPDRVAAAIGPCIGPNSYEVGDEFRQTFVAAAANAGRYFAPATRGGHWRFDLPRYVADRCRAAGISDISVLGRDSYADAADFFSYRRTVHAGERDYGRNLSAICLAPDK